MEKKKDLNINDEFRLWFQAELTERCKRNPSYSLRAFATLLEMDSSTVSQLISGKRKASKKLISKICNRLQADSKLEEKFCKASSKVKENLKDLSPVETDYQLLSEDAITVLANWYYFAILEIINIDGFQSRPSWIANRLSITTAEVKIAIERLVRLKLLRVEDKKIKRTENFLSTYMPGQTSFAQKEFQKQVLKMALTAIEDVPIEKRDMSNMTMAIDVDKLPEAKKLITKFRRELSQFLEDGEQTKVYQLGIQLYPISK